MMTFQELVSSGKIGYFAFRREKSDDGRIYIHVQRQGSDDHPIMTFEVINNTLKGPLINATTAA